MNVLAVIPARGGSKGVPRKNLREVAGRPLLAWTIEEARRCASLDRIVLSSEDPEVITVARRYKCEVPFVRPADLARDDTPGIEPVLHALGELPGYDYVVLLQPTSPLRTAADIDGCVDHCRQLGAPACVSVAPCRDHPALLVQMEAGSRLRRLYQPPTGAVRRQDYPEFFVLNGAVYVARSDWLLSSRTFLTDETAGYVMPRERSLDIDSEGDLQFFAALVGAPLIR